MSVIEDVLQKEVAVAGCVMQFMTGFLVVSEIGENSSFFVNCVRPIWIVQSSRQCNEFWLSFSTYNTKSALVAYWKQNVKRLDRRSQQKDRRSRVVLEIRLSLSTPTEGSDDCICYIV